LFQGFTNGGQVLLNADEAPITASIEKAVLALKVLRKAVVHGIRKPHENENAMILLRTLIGQIRIVLPFSKYIETKLRVSKVAVCCLSWGIFMLRGLLTQILIIIFHKMWLKLAKHDENLKFSIF
jgi:hypothetical protein